MFGFIKDPCTGCQCQQCASNSVTCCINRPIECPDSADYDPAYRCPGFIDRDEFDPRGADRCPACGGTAKATTKKGKIRIECDGDCWTQTGLHDTAAEAIAEWRKIRKEREESESNATD